ncbi:TetR/AcrR family transcriptional regulator [Vibrio paucivorans]|uniref:TetR/AcrR family transcriptional regulator n=1 Tax=Vibrio paucivorans TaxID=2829489 RepID=A0A9X3CHL4_9VIBR|nr:TetR/AcrR family transcriptional regulator [Vibrio paucivorans]MCW8336008.1 TetR/AcrR family transcriptional regulator [Vibrio paucivorans]
MKVSEKKRLDIMEAAQQEFVEHGYVAANMDRLCEQAGVSKRTLYRHFENKQTLFIEAMSHIVHSFRDKLILNYDSAEPLASQLKRHMEVKLDALYEEFGMPLARMLISEFIREPELAQEYLRLIHRRDDELEKWIQAAIKDGKLIEGDAAKMTKMLMCLYQGHFLWPQLVSNTPVAEPEVRSALLDDIIQLFLAGYQVSSGK